MDEAHVWNSLAKRYDAIVRLFETSYPAIRHRLSQDLGGRQRVLEVAAGTGQFTFDIAAVADSVVATDVAPEMIRRLSEIARDKAATRVLPSVMSAYEIDALDGAYDAVFCANGLHVMEHPARALSEFRRVLVEGGRLVAPTFLHGTDLARRGLSVAMSAVSPFVARSRYDLDGLCRQIEAAGFVVKRRDRLPGLFPIGYVVAERARDQESIAPSQP